jgi:hypothetical protein
MAKPSLADLKAAFAAQGKPKSRKQAPAEDSKYTAEEKAKMDAEGKGLSGAAKEWQKKFQQMNETEFWLCFCFKSDEDLAEFASAAGIDGAARGAYLRGEDVAEQLGLDLSVEELPKEKLVKFKVDRDAIKAASKYKPHPDPIGDLPEYDDPDDAIDATVEALHAYLNGPGQDQKWLAKHGMADDYPNWFIVWFQNVETADKFLRLTNLTSVGNKYLDGYKAAVAMDLDIWR